MDALASELLLRAESVAGVLHSLDRQLDSTTFEGPAAMRLREEMLRRRRRGERTARELEDAAYLLKRHAVGIRDEIAELQLAARREEDPGMGR